MRPQNPASLIEQIDLYREFIPAIDANLLNGWEKLEGGEPLTEDEGKIMGRMAEICSSSRGIQVCNRHAAPQF